MIARHPGLKLIATFVAAVFFMTSLGIMPETFAATGAGAPELPFLSGKSLDIPAEFGQVTDTVIGSPSLPTFIHIQSAHGNYGAEKNIENILGSIAKNSSVSLMLLEGAASKLQPELLRIFPKHPDFNRKITDKLMQEGYITGPENFLINQKPKGTGRHLMSSSFAGFGIEDLAAYKKDREAFINVVENEKTAEKFLGSLRATIDKRFSSKLNKDLLNLVRQEEAFGSGTVSFEGWLKVLGEASRKHLKLDLSDAFYQDQYPFLIRYYRLQTIGSKINREKAMTEFQPFIKELEKRKIPMAVIELFKIELDAQVASGLSPVAGKTQATSSYSPLRHAFDLLFEKLPKDFSMKSWPDWILYAQHLILMQELEGKGLHEETVRLKDKIETALAKTDVEKAYLAGARQLYLLKRLFLLELTRSEYEELQNLSQSSPNAKSQRGDMATLLPGDLPVFQTAMSFYATAVVREKIMFANALKRMKEQKQDRAVIVTGGFHTDGLKELAKSKGCSYLQITPRINEITKRDHEIYLKSILGPSKRDTVLPAKAGIQAMDLPFLRGRLRHSGMTRENKSTDSSASQMSRPLILTIKDVGPVTGNTYVARSRAEIYLTVDFGIHSEPVVDQPVLADALAHSFFVTGNGVPSATIATGTTNAQTTTPALVRSEARMQSDLGSQAPEESLSFPANFQTRFPFLNLWNDVNSALKQYGKDHSPAAAAKVSWQVNALVNRLVAKGMLGVGADRMVSLREGDEILSGESFFISSQFMSQWIPGVIDALEPEPLVSVLAEAIAIAEKGGNPKEYLQRSKQLSSEAKSFPRAWSGTNVSALVRELRQILAREENAARGVEVSSVQIHPGSFRVFFNKPPVVGDADKERMIKAPDSINAITQAMQADERSTFLTLDRSVLDPQNGLLESEDFRLFFQHLEVILRLAHSILEQGQDRLIKIGSLVLSRTKYDRSHWRNPGRNYRLGSLRTVQKSGRIVELSRKKILSASRSEAREPDLVNPQNETSESRIVGALNQWAKDNEPFFPKEMKLWGLSVRRMPRFDVYGDASRTDPWTPSEKYQCFKLSTLPAADLADYLKQGAFVTFGTFTLRVDPSQGKLDPEKLSESILQFLFPGAGRENPWLFLQKASFRWRTDFKQLPGIILQARDGKNARSEMRAESDPQYPFAEFREPLKEDTRQESAQSNWALESRADQPSEQVDTEPFAGDLDSPDKPWRPFSNTVNSGSVTSKVPSGIYPAVDAMLNGILVDAAVVRRIKEEVWKLYQTLKSVRRGGLSQANFITELQALPKGNSLFAALLFLNSRPDLLDRGLADQLPVYFQQHAFQQHAAHFHEAAIRMKLVTLIESAKSNGEKIPAAKIPEAKEEILKLWASLGGIEDPARIEIFVKVMLVFAQAFEIAKPGKPAEISFAAMLETVDASQEVAQSVLGRNDDGGLGLGIVLNGVLFLSGFTQKDFKRSLVLLYKAMQDAKDIPQPGAFLFGGKKLNIDKFGSYFIVTVRKATPDGELVVRPIGSLKPLELRASAIAGGRLADFLAQWEPFSDRIGDLVQVVFSVKAPKDFASFVAEHRNRIAARSESRNSLVPFDVLKVDLGDVSTRWRGMSVAAVLAEPEIQRQIERELAGRGVPPGSLVSFKLGRDLRVASDAGGQTVFNVAGYPAHAMLVLNYHVPKSSPPVVPEDGARSEMRSKAGVGEKTAGMNRRSFLKFLAAGAGALAAGLLAPSQAPVETTSVPNGIKMSFDPANLNNSYFNILATSETATTVAVRLRDADGGAAVITKPVTQGDNFFEILELFKAAFPGQDPVNYAKIVAVELVGQNTFTGRVFLSLSPKDSGPYAFFSGMSIGGAFLGYGDNGGIEVYSSEISSAPVKFQGALNGVQRLSNGHLRLRMLDTVKQTSVDVYEIDLATLRIANHVAESITEVAAGGTGPVTNLPFITEEVPGSSVPLLQTLMIGESDRGTTVSRSASHVGVLSAGRDEGGGVTFNNLQTAGPNKIETFDASALLSLTHRLEGTQDRVRYEVVSVNPFSGIETKASVMVTGIQPITGQPRNVTIPIALLANGNTGLDAAHLGYIFLMNPVDQPAKYVAQFKAELPGQTFIAPATSLTPADITSIPEPAVVLVAADGNTSTVAATPRGAQLQFKTKPGSWVGVTFAYDDYGTPTPETQDLSGFPRLVFGLKATVNGFSADVIDRVKFEIIDRAGNKATATLGWFRADGIERVYAIPAAVIQAQGVDLAHVTVMHFIVEEPAGSIIAPPGITGTLDVFRIPLLSQPLITQAPSTRNGWQLKFQESPQLLPGQGSYQAETSTDLRDWTNCSSAIMGGPSGVGMLVVTNNGASGINDQRFYRVVRRTPPARSEARGVKVSFDEKGWNVTVRNRQISPKTIAELAKQLERVFGDDVSVSSDHGVWLRFDVQRYDWLSRLLAFGLDPFIEIHVQATNLEGLRSALERVLSITDVRYSQAFLSPVAFVETFPGRSSGWASINAALDEVNAENKKSVEARRWVIALVNRLAERGLLYPVIMNDVIPDAVRNLSPERLRDVLAEAIRITDKGGVAIPSLIRSTAEYKSQDTGTPKRRSESRLEESSEDEPKSFGVPFNVPGTRVGVTYQSGIRDSNGHLVGVTLEISKNTALTSGVVTRSEARKDSAAILAGAEAQLTQVADKIRLDGRLLQKLLSYQRILEVNVPVQHMRFFDLGTPAEKRNVKVGDTLTDQVAGEKFQVMAVTGDMVTLKSLDDPRERHLVRNLREEDGITTEHFGYRVGHNDALGAFKGGLRFAMDVDRDECKVLALWMTLKNAIAGNPFGGGKGGVQVDPTALSKGERERLTRNFVRELFTEAQKIGQDAVGPYIDVPAGDIGTGENEMGWFMDEVLRIKHPNLITPAAFKAAKVGETLHIKAFLQDKTLIDENLVYANWLATITGKPVPLGGAEDRTPATGRGVFVVAREAVKVFGSMLGIGNTIAGKTIALEGFGAVGRFAGKNFDDAGSKIMAIKEVVFEVRNGKRVARPFLFRSKTDKGIDIKRLMRYLAEGGKDYKSFVEAYQDDVEEISEEGFWKSAVQILVPAAKQGTVTPEVARLIAEQGSVKLIVEGANGPLTKEAWEYLQTKGVMIVPDVLANAGGVISSKNEWWANLTGETLPEAEAIARMEAQILSAFHSVVAIMRAFPKMSFRDAAYVRGIVQVADAEVARTPELQKLLETGQTPPQIFFTGWFFKFVREWLAFFFNYRLELGWKPYHLPDSIPKGMPVTMRELNAVASREGQRDLIQRSDEALQKEIETAAVEAEKRFKLGERGALLIGGVRASMKHSVALEMMRILTAQGYNVKMLDLEYQRAEDVVRLRANEEIDVKNEEGTPEKISWANDEILVVVGLEALSPKIIESLGDIPYYGVHAYKGPSLLLPGNEVLMGFDLRILLDMLASLALGTENTIAQVIQRWQTQRIEETRKVFVHANNANTRINTYLPYELPILVNHLHALIQDALRQNPHSPFVRNTLERLDKIFYPLWAWDDKLLQDSNSLLKAFFQRYHWQWTAENTVTLPRGSAGQQAKTHRSELRPWAEVSALAHKALQVINQHHLDEESRDSMGVPPLMKVYISRGTETKPPQDQKFAWDIQSSVIAERVTPLQAAGVLNAEDVSVLQKRMAVHSGFDLSKRSEARSPGGQQPYFDITTGKRLIFKSEIAEAERRRLEEAKQKRKAVATGGILPSAAPIAASRSQPGDPFLVDVSVNPEDEALAERKRWDLQAEAALKVPWPETTVLYSRAREGDMYSHWIQLGQAEIVLKSPTTQEKGNLGTWLPAVELSQEQVRARLEEWRDKFHIIKNVEFQLVEGDVSSLGIVDLRPRAPDAAAPVSVKIKITGNWKADMELAQALEPFVTYFDAEQILAGLAEQKKQPVETGVAALGDVKDPRDKAFSGFYLAPGHELVYRDATKIVTVRFGLFKTRFFIGDREQPAVDGRFPLQGLFETREANGQTRLNGLRARFQTAQRLARTLAFPVPLMTEHELRVKLAMRLGEIKSASDLEPGPGKDVKTLRLLGDLLLSDSQSRTPYVTWLVSSTTQFSEGAERPGLKLRDALDINALINTGDVASAQAMLESREGSLSPESVSLIRGRLNPARSEIREVGLLVPLGLGAVVAGIMVFLERRSKQVESIWELFVRRSNSPSGAFHDQDVASAYAASLAQTRRLAKVIQVLDSQWIDRLTADLASMDDHRLTGWIGEGLAGRNGRVYCNFPDPAFIQTYIDRYERAIRDEEQSFRETLPYAAYGLHEDLHKLIASAWTPVWYRQWRAVRLIQTDGRGARLKDYIVPQSVKNNRRVLAIIEEVLVKRSEARVAPAALVTGAPAVDRQPYRRIVNPIKLTGHEGSDNLIAQIETARRIAADTVPLDLSRSPRYLVEIAPQLFGGTVHFQAVPAISQIFINKWQGFGRIIQRIQTAQNGLMAIDQRHGVPDPASVLPSLAAARANPKAIMLLALISTPDEVGAFQKELIALDRKNVLPANFIIQTFKNEDEFVSTFGDLYKRYHGGVDGMPIALVTDREVSTVTDKIGFYRELLTVVGDERDSIKQTAAVLLAAEKLFDAAVWTRGYHFVSVEKLGGLEALMSELKNFVATQAKVLASA